jgi:hypothetical protein
MSAADLDGIRAAADRSPPHSAEAEEHVIACCLLDGDSGKETIARCVEASLTPDCFYLPVNRLLFRVIVELSRTSDSVTLEILAEELKTRRQLEVAGGYAYLTQVTSKIPTTAHAAYFIGKVREKYLLRELIKTATGAVESAYSFTGTLAEAKSLVDDVCSQLAPEVERATSAELTFEELLNFDTSTDTDSLLGFRYLGRTGGMIVVGPSGLGKSVLSVQIGILSSVGRHIFGLRVVAPLRVLYVQAEDDNGDVAEAVQGVVASYDLTDEERALAAQNFRTVRWADATGERFISRLLSEHSRHPFDLLIINPLFSFAGCDLLNPAQVGNFFRHLLNPLLFRTKSAAIVVHHTKKPNADPKVANNEDNAAYDPFGSSDITNWARAVISMQTVKGSGNRVCKLIFGKRGARARLTDNEGRPTTSVLVEHSSKGLCWVPSDWTPATSSNGQYAPKYDINRARLLYNPARTWPDNKRVIAADMGCDPRTVHGWKSQLETVDFK